MEKKKSDSDKSGGHATASDKSDSGKVKPKGTDAIPKTSVAAPKLPATTPAKETGAIPKTPFTRTQGHRRFQPKVNRVNTSKESNSPKKPEAANISKSPKKNNSSSSEINNNPNPSPKQPTYDTGFKYVGNKKSGSSKKGSDSDKSGNSFWLPSGSSDEMKWSEDNSGSGESKSKKSSSNSHEKNKGKEAYSGAVCRICMKGSSKSLITPCDCKGIYAHVHPACLNEWLETTGSDHCDICRYKYNMSKSPKTICDWIKDENKSSDLSTTAINLGISLFILFLAFVVCWNIYGVITPVLFWMLAIFTLFWIIYIFGMLLLYIYTEVSKYNKWKKDHFKVRVRDNPDHGKVEAFSPPPNMARATGFSPPTSPTVPAHIDPEKSVQKVEKVPDRKAGGGFSGPRRMAVGQGPTPYQHPGHNYGAYGGHSWSSSPTDSDNPTSPKVDKFGLPRKTSSSSSELLPHNKLDSPKHTPAKANVPKQQKSPSKPVTVPGQVQAKLQKEKQQTHHHSPSHSPDKHKVGVLKKGTDEGKGKQGSV